MLYNNIPIVNKKNSVLKQNIIFFLVLMKCFNGFCKEGVVHADTVGEILQMMGLRVKKEALQAIIDEVDEDGKTDITCFSTFSSICI